MWIECSILFLIEVREKLIPVQIHFLRTISFYFLLPPGYFFNNRKRDENSDLHSNEGHDYLPTVIPSNSTMMTTHDNSNTTIHYPHTITSEESDNMMELPLDDLSVVSSQWLYPSDKQQQQQQQQSRQPPSAEIPFEYPPEFENFFESDFDTDHEGDEEGEENVEDDDDDDNSLNNLCPLLDETLKKSFADTQLELIRQGVLPKCPHSKVCSKPKTSDELFACLSAELKKNMLSSKKSDLTMQYRRRYDLSVPVSEDHPEQVTTVPMTVSVQGERALLGNTKFLSDMRNNMAGKVLTEEEKEDMVVLSLLGE
jgi:hypothetical protein